jgi:cation-transporting ATPase E
LILVANALIGIGQELRAKVTLDRLAILAAPRARVVRDGVARELQRPGHLRSWSPRGWPSS